MIGMLYSSTGILAIVIHCIVNADTLFLKKEKSITNTTIFYHRFLWGVFFYFLTDTLWGILDEFGLLTALKIDTFIYYIAMAVAVVLWTDYVVAYLSQNSLFGKIVRYFGRIFVLFEIAMLIVNSVYPFFFWFDEEGVYHAGPIRYFALCVQIALFMASTIQALAVAARSEGEKHRRHVAICLVSLSMSIAIFAQIFYPFWPIYSMGYLVAICFLHIFVREDEKAEYYQNIQREMNLISSMAGMYFCCYYVDLQDKTYTQIANQIEENNTFIGEQGDAVETLDKMCKHLIFPEYKTEVQKFVDLDTLDERLTPELHYISMRFESVHTGWSEGVFIEIDRDSQGKLKHVMWAIRSINDEKAREKKLILNSYLDELTGLYNRKMYAEDVDDIEGSMLESVNAVDIDRADFVFVSMDVNGLKVINDSKGHAAGDELLIGAAECMKECLEPYGRVYRTGGDEFIALLNTDNVSIETIMRDFEEATARYKGKYVDSVSVSYGYVLRKEHPDMPILEVEKLADKNMYLAKRLHYSSIGVDRRMQHQNAYLALCALYTKILKINLTENTYSIISMDESEQSPEKGFSDGIFDWLENFAKSGQVHPDDVEAYLAHTNRTHMVEHFRSGKKVMSVFYRRLIDGEYLPVEMKLVPTESYSHENQNLYLFVRNAAE